MKIIQPCFEILHMADTDEIYRHLELAARTCYKSEDKISSGTAAQFLKRIVKSGHESVIEHISISARIVCDRGVTHELVRHRLCSFSQESTRYANYSKEKFGNEITVIKPFFWKEDSQAYETWKEAMKACEKAYLALIENGAKAQEARSVLPNSLKTDIIITANIREWRHIFKLRCSKASHPQMREIMLPMLEEFYKRVPVLFETLYETYKTDIDSFKY
ncbi:ThyX [Desulfamplus magnetovallimortis]|uniref:FAD-dependent thymidylate synthase n=1 Tax=Desulfamplus magnetovallimortis TaxID=1246637 RepID=A0A1W1HKW7_9BACT|nr:FAD-dependent thymidylate synthase [Desulfamplus magnetovallimortis]SLM33065.1 ThyX [Desulfamplus magnetovallimortis]